MVTTSPTMKERNSTTCCTEGDSSIVGPPGYAWWHPLRVVRAHASVLACSQRETMALEKSALVDRLLRPRRIREFGPRRDPDGRKAGVYGRVRGYPTVWRSSRRRQA